MRALDDTALLSLWERGAARHALDRAALLAAAARPDWPPESIADRPLGAVGDALLRLRVASFGTRLDGHADCRHCGERLGFTLDLRDLLAEAPAEPVPGETTAAGLRLRAPSLRDLAAVAALQAEEAARRLLARCMLAGTPDALDDAARLAAEQALEALDPQADLALALRCAACGTEDLAQLDAAALLWDEIEARARALLRAVHQLAQAYGWSEPQVLALSPLRRAHYLALTGGAA
ncbi:hypothetical protein [Pseudorhodoferax sp.]|uniref:hypothetical protein n=1 Tax=Pseudorhodoferax sp. TaxID=1993553 RepID=UPI0039E21926